MPVMLRLCCCLQDRCKAWAADGECKKNVDYMLISCKASCSNCKLYSTTKPFKMVQLNSGHAMPTVGFGTAGLGVGTAAAVQYALAKGYRMIDTAEVGPQLFPARAAATLLLSRHLAMDDADVW